VLSFGGIMGMGDKLFAIPWQAFKLDEANKQFVLDVPREKLEQAPGFDKDDWPDMAQPEFRKMVHEYYGMEPMTGERMRKVS